jgi:hypothetical protein
MAQAGSTILGMIALYFSSADKRRPNSSEPCIFKKKKMQVRYISEKNKVMVNAIPFRFSFLPGSFFMSSSCYLRL